MSVDATWTKHTCLNCFLSSSFSLFLTVYPGLLSVCAWEVLYMAMQKIKILSTEVEVTAYGWVAPEMPLQNHIRNFRNSRGFASIYFIIKLYWWRLQTYISIWFKAYRIFVNFMIFILHKDFWNAFLKETFSGASTNFQNKLIALLFFHLVYKSIS